MNRLMRQTAKASHNTYHPVCLKDNVDIASQGCANQAVQAYEGTLHCPDGGRHIKKHCPIGDDSHALIEKAIDKFGLSACAFNGILKIARPIADLAGKDNIKVIHTSEMIQYRSLGQKNLFREEVCCALGIFDCWKPRFDKNLSYFCQKLFQNLLRLLFIFSPLLWIIPKSEKKRESMYPCKYSGWPRQKSRYSTPSHPLLHCWHKHC